MAYDKLVDSTQLDNNLTSVANAIRTKGGTSGQLAFPNGFVSAVNAIPTGTTPTGTKQISITQNGTTTENVTDYASAQITANVPQMQRITLRPAYPILLLPCKKNKQDLLTNCNPSRCRTLEIVDL